MEDALKEIRQAVEDKLASLLGNASSSHKWANVQGDLLQVYLLLRILDKLESIDDSLITMLNPSGTETPLG